MSDRSIDLIKAFLPQMLTVFLGCAVIYVKVNQHTEQLEKLTEKLDKRIENEQVMQLQAMQFKTELSLLELRVTQLEKLMKEINSND